ncbi:MAG: 4-hydroxy-3-methylbut-2-enyl diphosphate reductase [Gammaproteobacteria bacterium]|nr:4-hydroxy-3-methylbut-2-enyl diphosphate reductase [Gammaproteobacteria bacterium]
MKKVQIKLANPRGFCAGVERAIEIVERALEQFGAPIYVRHEVVHNRFVVNNLRDKGAIFIDELEQVPDSSTVIFSAHGVAQSVREEAKQRGLTVFDATCPLVTKVHMEVIRNCRQGFDTILIGHRGHPEVEGTMGQHDETNGGNIYLVETVEDVTRLGLGNDDELAYVTQTTLSVDDTKDIIQALQNRFPKIQAPKRDDICYATQNRQDAVKSIVDDCDLLLVVGSNNSSNSNRLKEIASKKGIAAYLIDDASQISEQWLTDCHVIGITAGASAPEVLVQQVMEKVSQLSNADVHEVDGVKEDIAFSLPRELRIKKDE